MPGTSFTMSDELHERIQNQLIGSESVSQFCHRAAEEKVNRLEKRDERARRQQFEKDLEILRPLVVAIMEEMREEEKSR